MNKFKVDKIKAQNIFNFHDVEVGLGDFVFVAGANGAGKSNFLKLFDIIFAYDKMEKSEILRLGASSGSLYAEMHCGEMKLEYTRKFTEKGTSVKILDHTNSRSLTVTEFNQMFTGFPVANTLWSMNVDKQAKMLAEAFGFDKILEKYNEEKEFLSDKRRLVGQQVKAFGEIELEKVEKPVVSVADAVSKRDELAALSNRIETEAFKLENLNQLSGTVQGRIDEIKARIEALEKELFERMLHKSEVDDVQIPEKQALIINLKNQYQSDLESAGDVNEIIRQHEKYNAYLNKKEKHDEAVALKEKYSGLSIKLNELSEKFNEDQAKIDTGIPGVKFQDAALTLDGVKIFSSGQALRIAMAVAVKSQLPVCMKDFDLLDDKNAKTILKDGLSRDGQFLIEAVGDNPEGWESLNKIAKETNAEKNTTLLRLESGEIVVVVEPENAEAGNANPEA